MAPDPAPPPVVLAIPAPSLPPNLSSLSPNSDPRTSTSVLSSPASSPASPAPASQQQCEDQARHKLPADLLCFQSFFPPSSSVESPPDQRFSAMPEPPPAAPTVLEAPSSTFPQLPSSSPRRHHPADASVSAQPAVLKQCPPPVRRNASASTFSVPSTAVPPESAAPFPPLSSSPPKLPHHADAPLPGQPSDLQHRSPPVRRNAQVNPLHPKSYAQAAKGTPGPGFVRAHARDVASFARLPRTGLNVICGSHEGMPACSFVSSELPKVEGLYAKALVMKFHGGRPSLAASHKEFSNWGFESSFSIGPLSSKSFLLRFQEERDLLKILTRPSSTLLTFPYKVFRWHNRLHIKEESCLVPIWISLPRIPTQCFAPEFLESFASLIGRFLCLDKATATLARPSEARMCIEIDLRKERPQFIWIGLFEGFKQPIVYERVPKFCTGCHVQGHTNVECSKSSLDTLQSHNSGPNPTVQECLQPVRSNAKEISAAVSHENPQQSRASSFAAATDPLLTSELSHQDLPQPIVAAAPSEQQLCDPLPLPPPPLKPAPPDPAQQMPAVQPSLQSSVAAASHLTAPPQSSVVVATQQPIPSPPAPLLPPPCQQPSQPTMSAAQPPLQSSNSEALQQHLTQSPSSAKASSSEPHPPDAPPLLSEVEQAVSPSVFPPAAVRSSNLSAQAAPFPSSGPVQPSQKSSPLNNQLSTSFLPVYINSNGATYATSLPQKSLPIGYAPNPSFTHHQIHAFEGYDSENSFETDSQPNSPLESAKEEANRCPFPPQSCASEGEQPTEDQPGFQGHISDVEFYHQPISSKKNKRQPDGPLRVKLRTRKGVSLHR